MNKIFYLLTFVYFISNGYAFLNIEALRQSPMNQKLLGSSKVMLSQQKGNVDKTIINFNSLARYNNGKNNFLGLIDYQYGESFEQIDTRQGHAHLRYSFEVSKAF